MQKIRIKKIQISNSAELAEANNYVCDRQSHIYVIFIRDIYVFFYLILAVNFFFSEILT